MLCWVLMVAFGQTTVDTSTLERFNLPESPTVHATMLERAVEFDIISVEIESSAWNSSHLFVRERLSTALFAQEDVSRLKGAWSYTLSEQERCRLALRLYALGDQESMIAGASASTKEGPSWPVFAQGTLEDQWTCALASSTIIGLSAPLTYVLKRADFPLSMPFVWDVYWFAQVDTISSIRPQMEWVEEGLRAPLWTVLTLRDPEWVSDYTTQVTTWGVGECMDAVDVLWTVGTTDSLLDRKSLDSVQTTPVTTSEALQLLSILSRHSSACKEWSRFAKWSIQSSHVRRLKSTFMDIAVVRDELIGVFRVLESRSALSKTQARKIRRWVEPLYQRGLEDTVLLELLQGVHLWADSDTIEWLSSLEQSTTDTLLLLEIHSALYRIERIQSRQEQMFK
jgi:hypothetical protein